MNVIFQVVAIVVAYSIGSIPSAVILSKLMYHVDIRSLGDGNMGAQNMAHTLGFKAGLIIALVDVLKGTFAVLIARALGLTFGWQMVVGVFAILGHDFPVFAHFKGGQGTASTAGVFLALFPVPTVFGFMVIVLLYLITRKYFIAAPTGGGVLFLSAILMHQPWYTISYMLVLYLFIPLKKLADRGRVKEIKATEGQTTPSDKQVR